MNKFIQEYGRLVIAIIVMFGFFAVLGILLSHTNKNSIYNVQKSKTQSSSALYSDNKEGEDIASSDTFNNIIGDVVESDTAPYFKINETNNDNFGITTDAISYKDLFKNVRIYYKGQDITDKDSANGEKVKVTVLAYNYLPVLATENGNVNSHVVMEEVDAKDKYGHYIYDDNGERVKTIQPKYSISDSVVVNKNNYIDTSARTCKIQIVYRVQINSYKAECKVMYIKNRETGTTNKSGLTKIKFSNER